MLYSLVACLKQLEDIRVVERWENGLNDILDLYSVQGNRC